VEKFSEPFRFYSLLLARRSRRKILHDSKEPQRESRLIAAQAAGAASGTKRA
jgi:hypothetical protein